MPVQCPCNAHFKWLSFFAPYKAWQSFTHDFDPNLGNYHVEIHLALNIPHSESSLWSLRNEIRCLFDLPSTYNSQISTQGLLISAIRLVVNGGKMTTLVTCSCQLPILAFPSFLCPYWNDSKSSDLLLLQDELAHIYEDEIALAVELQKTDR